MRTIKKIRDTNGLADEFIAGLAKGLAIIEVFGQRQSMLTVTEASEATGISRAAARRCLRTLHQTGYADFDGKYYRLLPRILRLGNAYIVSNSLPRYVQPIIETTSERTKRSMSVAVLDGTDVLIIARAHVRRSLSVGLGIGSRLPAYCSANGRILLSGLLDPQLDAFLKRLEPRQLTVHTKIRPSEIARSIRTARTAGYATNDQEVELGVRTIAVPIRDRAGTIVASVSTSGPVDDPDLKALLKMLPELEAARRRIEASL